MSESNGAVASRPKALDVLPDAIPGDLQGIPQWVVWSYVEDVDPETGEVDWDKPPRNARNGSLASSTNKRTWATFTEALAFFHATGLDGIGFVLHRAKNTEGAGLVAIDLDKCRDPETGIIEPWALEIIRLIDSYTEVSPSGRGIRIFLRGKLPAHGRKKGPYENYETGRYVTVTGQHVEGTPRAIEDRQPQLERVHRGIFGEPADSVTATNGNGHAPCSAADAEVIEAACRSRSGAKIRRLLDGDITGYPSHSEADLALCNYLAFWCGPNSQERIAEIVASSGLFRSKWKREDYAARTIGKALAGRTEFYDWERYRGRRSNRPASGEIVPAPGQSDGEKVDGEILPASDSPGAEQTEKAPLHLTDWGNAQRLVQGHGHDLRHCHAWSKWLAWDGWRWKEDATAEVVRKAKGTIAGLFRWASDLITRLAKQLEQESKQEGGADE